MERLTGHGPPGPVRAAGSCPPGRIRRHMKKTFWRVATVAAAAGWIVPAQAHHGRDFLVVQDYSLPSPLAGNIVTNFSWENGDSDDEFRLEPGFIVGLAPRLALETSVSFQDEGSGWDYSSVDPALHIQLTDPASDFPIKIGLSAGYQFGNVAAEEHHHEHAEDGHHEGGEHESADEADGAGHEHGGIHRHGEDLFHARLVLETDFTERLKGVVNIVGVVPDKGSAAWGYAAGLRYAFNHEIGIGAEAIGDFGDGNEEEIVAAAYLTPVHQVSVKLGAGFGLTEETPDFSLHAGLVFRW